MLLAIVTTVYQSGCIVAVILGLVWLIKELLMGINRDERRLDGKVAVVTGGTAGIGYETAKDLAARGATVIITGRDMEKGRRVLNRMKDETGNLNIHLRSLDLSRQPDVKRFAKDVGNDFPQINYLINNAGLMGDTVHKFRLKEASRATTEDGFEMTMASNFLGHVTLTENLLPRLKAAAKTSHEPSRIVHVSSELHLIGSLDADYLDWNMERQPLDAQVQYGNSKLAQVLYSKHLSLRLKETNVESISLHPGPVRTDIFRSQSGSAWLVNTLVFWVIGKTCWQGAQTVIYAATTNDPVNGTHLGDCRKSPKFLVSRAASDEEYVEEVCRKALKLLELAPEEQ